MKLKVILLALALLIFALSLSAGIIYFDTSKSNAINKNHHDAINKTIRTAANIDLSLHNNAASLARLASTEVIKYALGNPTPDSIFEANEALDNFSNAFQNSVFFLMDTTGMTLASSNQYSADSFIGKNYSFRPYFQEAVKGTPSLYIARGVTSHKFGVYQSYPVYSPDGSQIVGVAVGKFHLDDIATEINQGNYSGIIAMASPDKIILLSNRPELNLHSLWEPSPALIKKLSESRQFGPGPWPWTGIKKIDAGHAVGADGNQYVFHRQKFEAIPDWEIIYLHDNTAFVLAYSRELARNVGWTIFITILVLNLLVLWLYVMANREIDRRKSAENKLLHSKDELQYLVEARTTELQQSNLELHKEIEEHKSDTAKLEYSNKAMEILNRVLRISQGSVTLQEFLNEFLHFASSFTGLGLQAKGAIFLVENDQPNVLQMAAQYNLNDHLLTACHQVPFGKCICGRAAESGKPLFVSHIDKRHEISFEGIKDHGHYCIPVISKEKKIIGLYNVYTTAGKSYDPALEELLVSISSVLASIVESKMETEKRKASHEKHRAITSTANDSIIMVDHHGLITFWNPAAEKLFGYKRYEALGQDMHSIITPQRFYERAMIGFNNFTKTGNGKLVGKTTETVGIRKDGEEFPLELSISPVRQGNHWSAIGIIRDITERKETEIKKAEIDQQLRQAQKMESIGTLAGGIAHDFNNILSSIIGYTELIKEDMEPSKTESLSDLDQVIKAGNRAKELVKQILTFSRQTEDDVHPIQISLIIKEAIKLLRSSLPQNIEIKQMISSANQTVLSDPAQINQIIMNLCTNSYRAMREKGGTLEIRLESFAPDQVFTASHPGLLAANYLRLTVSDTGLGIDPAVLPRIFDPYFSTNKKEDGTGLGLSVVHGIITKLHGFIEVDSKLNVGTTFKIFLPLLETTPRQHTSADSEAISGGTESILLVDDELPILQLEERMLNALGYKTSCRTSSIEALELFRNKPDKFDLIISDQSMPNMTGSQLAEETAKIRPDIPIILCTGYSELNIVKSTDSGGVQEILMKPINKIELSQTIRKVLAGNKKL